MGCVHVLDSKITWMCVCVCVCLYHHPGSDDRPGKAYLKKLVSLFYLILGVYMCFAAQYGCMCLCKRERDMLAVFLLVIATHINSHFHLISDCAFRLHVLLNLVLFLRYFCYCECLF